MRALAHVDKALVATGKATAKRLQLAGRRGHWMAEGRADYRGGKVRS